MEVKGRTKDTKKSRRDLADHCKRRKLHLDKGKNDKMPVAPFVLSKEKKKVLCKWVLDLKFPDGYASNIGRCVNLDEGKFFGLKSHDCHVFMERLFPAALRELLPVQIWKVITEVSQFFRKICSSNLKVDDMNQLEQNIAEIICKLERIFPPAFFNVMEHLPIHLPYEARVGGPVQYRWMYPFERFLHHLKRKVGNKAKVEGSICNAYLTEEISNFCSNYFESHVDTKTKDPSRNAPRVILDIDNTNIPPLFSVNVGYATTSGELKFLNDKDYQIAHGYVLANCELLRDYERLFEIELSKRHPRVSKNQIWNKFVDKYPQWLKEFVTKSDNITDDIVKTLATGPFKVVRKYDHYYINGYNFHTYSYGKNKSTMNYGVCVKSLHGVDYYGILHEVIELVYAGETRTYQTILFKCEWFDPGNGTRIHPEYKIVEVDHTKRYNKYDPFILGFQAQQVYFAPYPSTKNDKDCWWVVFPVNVRSTIDIPIAQTAFQEDVNENPPLLSSPNEFMDELTAITGENDDEVDDGLLLEHETSSSSNDESDSETSNSFDEDDFSTDDDFDE